MRAHTFVVRMRRPVFGVSWMVLVSMVTLGAELEAQTGASTAPTSIVGRVVAADTLAPLPGAGVDLFGCNEFLCFRFLGFTLTEDDGSFRFDTDLFGEPLEAGLYQLNVGAGLYQGLLTEPFLVSEGEVFDVGDLLLERLRFIGTVSGRLVDLIDGRPLSGGPPSHAVASLQRCDEVDFCEFVTDILVDLEGRFAVDGEGIGAEVGSYRILGFAQQYELSITPRFALGEDEDLDLGDIAMDPWPVQLFEIHPCDHLPVEGGTCRFDLIVRNGEEERFSGAVWGLVEGLGIGSFVGSTRFQVGRVGADNPMPHRFNLASGDQELFELEFEVPEEVMNGSFFCATVLVGRAPSPHLDTLGERFLFCIAKGLEGFEVVPEAKGRRMLESLRRTPLP